MYRGKRKGEQRDSAIGINSEERLGEGIDEDWHDTAEREQTELHQKCRSIMHKQKLFIPFKQTLKLPMKIINLSSKSSLKTNTISHAVNINAVQMRNKNSIANNTISTLIFV